MRLSVVCTVERGWVKLQLFLSHSLSLFLALLEICGGTTWQTTFNIHVAHGFVLTHFGICYSNLFDFLCVCAISPWLYHQFHHIYQCISSLNEQLIHFTTHIETFQAHNISYNEIAHVTRFYVFICKYY